MASDNGRDVFLRAWIPGYFRLWRHRTWTAAIDFEERWGLVRVNAGLGVLSVGIVALSLRSASNLWSYLIAAIVGPLVLLFLALLGAALIMPAVMDYETRHPGRGVQAVVSAHRVGLMKLSFPLRPGADFIVPFSTSHGDSHLARMRFVPSNKIVALDRFPVLVDLGRSRRFVIKQLFDEGMVVESLGGRYPKLVEAELYYDDDEASE